MKRFLLMTALIFVLGLAGTAQAFFGLFGDSSKSVDTQGSEIVLDRASFKGGDAQYFEAEVDGKTVRFFVVESPDGVVRAAFDACDVCWRERKGYSQDGEFMICNNCGQKFHVSRINIVRGGCNPAPLDREERDGKLVITMDALKQGLRYF